MHDHTLRSRLELLGFTPNEAKVYMALLAHGPCTAGPIIRASRLHRNVVYTALDHLIQKKYVSEKKIRGRKHFSIASPQILEDEFKKKASLAREMANELRQRVPVQPDSFTVHEGAEEYTDLIMGLAERMPEGTVIYSSGTVHDGLTDASMGKHFDRFIDLLRRKDMKVKIIGNRKKKKFIVADMKRFAKGIFEVKYFPAQLDDPSVIFVFPELDTVLYSICPDSNGGITVISIVNKTLAPSLQRLFHNMWKISIP